MCKSSLIVNWSSVATRTNTRHMYNNLLHKLMAHVSSITACVTCNRCSLYLSNWWRMPNTSPGRAIESFRIEFYRIYGIYRICRILFSVILIYKLLNIVFSRACCWKQSRATYLLTMASGWLFVCLLVDRELNFKYCHQVAYNTDFKYLQQRALHHSAGATQCWQAFLVYRIHRILFLVLWIFQITKNRILQIL